MDNTRDSIPRDRPGASLYFYKVKLQQDPESLSRIFIGHGQYVQEAIWLLQQRFFERLSLGLGYLNTEKAGQLHKIQEKALSSGRQVEFGEIGMQSYLLNPGQICKLLEEAGIIMPYCESCERYFKMSVFPKFPKRPCPECGTALKQKVPGEEVVQQALRTGYSYPRPFLKAKLRSHNDFLFLDMQEASKMNLLQIDCEIHGILRAFRDWLAMFEERQPTDMAQLWGYIQNLQEFFWLCTQQSFVQLCLLFRYMKKTQMDYALEVQRRALCQGKQYHIGEVALQMYLLNEKEVHTILTALGNLIFTCKSCHKNYCQLVPSPVAYLCSDCGAPLESAVPEYETLVPAMRINLFQPIPLGGIAQIPNNRLVFFRSRGEHKPSFYLSDDEMAAAINAFHKWHDHDLPVAGDLPKKVDTSRLELFGASDTIQWEVSPPQENKTPGTAVPLGFDTRRLITSLDHIDLATSEEEIYDNNETIRLLPEALLAPGSERAIPESSPGTDSTVPSETPQHKEAGGTMVRDTEKKSVGDTEKKNVVDTEKKNVVGPVSMSKSNALYSPKKVHTPVPQKLLSQSEKKKTKGTAGSKRFVPHAPPATRAVRHHSTRKDKVLLVSLIIFAGIVVLGYMIFGGWMPGNTLARQSKAIDAPGKKPRQEPEPSLEENAIYSDGEADDIAILPAAITHDGADGVDLEGMLDGKDAGEATRMLLGMVQEAQLARMRGKPILLGTQHIAALRRLYEYHRHDRELSQALIKVLAVIGGKEAATALEEILRSGEAADKIAVIASLNSMGSEARASLLHALQEQSDSRIYLATAQALSRLCPEDEDVYQNLVMKFYGVSEIDMQQGIVSSMSAMKIPQQNSFFASVAANRDYNYRVRSEAIDALLSDRAHNASMFISDLSRLAQTEKGMLGQKAQKALLILSQ